MASTVTRIGSPTYAELSPEYFRQGGVWYTTRRWRGLRGDLIDIADTVSGEARITEEAFPWFVLTVTFQGQQVGSTTPSPNAQVTTLYTMDGPQRIDSIWSLPEVWAELQKITNLTARAALRSNLEALARGESYATSVDGSGNATTTAITLEGVISDARNRLRGGSPSVSASVLNALFGELARGVDSFVWDNVVITKQTVAPNASSVRATYNRRNAILKTSTLLSANPSMPNIMKGNLRSHLSTGYWLQGSPKIEQVDAATSRMTETYTYGESYSTAIYGAPI
jgi:hypothetical protein